MNMILAVNFIYAQFNTVKYTAPVKIEKKDSPISIKNENEVQTKIKTKKKFFNYTTKTELKKEIDSLKKIINSINAEKKSSQQSELKKTLEETLSDLLKKNFTESGSLKSIKKFDYVEEYKEPATSTKIAMPVSGKLTVTSPFGIRNHPIEGIRKMHNGIDLKANYENVYSVLDGFVSEVGYETKGGKYIKIKHSDRFESAYLHLSEIYYKIGEMVKAGYIIGKSGNTGKSTAPHLHFAVKEWGQHINPVKFLNDLVFANNLISK